jgi:hypothetical protein
MSTTGLVDLICVCRVNDQERRAWYRSVTAELLRDGDQASIRLLLQSELRSMLGEPTLELVSFEPAAE